MDLFGIDLSGAAEDVFADSTDWTQYADTASDAFGGMSANDYFSQIVDAGGNALGSGMFGTDDESFSSLFDMDLGQAAQAVMNSGGTVKEDGSITGIGPLDHVLRKVGQNLGERWEKDPLALISTGIGILGKIDAMRKQRSNRGYGGGGDAASYVAALPPRAEDKYRGANAPAVDAPARQAPRGGAPQPAPVGALSRVQPVQIPIKR